MQNLKSSCERLFRLYYKHNTEPDLDTLYNLLNSIHNLNDIFNKTLKDNFFESDEFIALKALRNLYHHQSEIENEFKIIPFEEVGIILSDLMYLCIIHKSSVEEAIQNIHHKYRDEHREKINSVFIWYNHVININPAIFNFVVKVYQKMESHSISLLTEEYLEFKNSYDYEIENGYSHFATGNIKCHPNDMGKIYDIGFS
ncbi:MAG: hypothetical protein MJK08_05920 [Campylobacterales bacterium]|nr:hypothetical protein [Campylobacterales bacterium]